MFQTLKNAWKIAELRKKILYTLFMLLIYRVLCFIPTPGVDTSVIASALERFSLLGFINQMTGADLANYSIMAMGITPYINASIIMQLLTVAIPKLEEMNKQGEEGRKKIAQITRYVTVGLGFLQAVALTAGLGASTQGALGLITIGFCLAAGTALAMWIGERITENGVGNGISLLIFAGIISNFAGTIGSYIYTLFVDISQFPLGNFIGMIVVFLVLIVGVVFVDLGERRVPVQYAKRVVGRKITRPVHPHPPEDQRQRRAAPDLRLRHHAVPGHDLRVLPEFVDQPVVERQRACHELGLSGHLRAADHCVHLLLLLDLLQPRGDRQEHAIRISIDPRHPSGQAHFGLHPEDLSPHHAVRRSVPGAPGGAAHTHLRHLRREPAVRGLVALIAVSVAMETMRQLESQMTMRHYKGFLN